MDDPQSKIIETRQKKMTSDYAVVVRASCSRKATLPNETRQVLNLSFKEPMQQPMLPSAIIFN